MDAKVEGIDAGRIGKTVKFVQAVAAMRVLLKRGEADGVVGWVAEVQLYAAPAAALAGVPEVWFQAGVQ